MIVPMQRLTLLCLTDERDAALAALRELGVVHVADRQPPAGDEVDTLRARLGEARRAETALAAAGPRRGDVAVRGRGSAAEAPAPDASQPSPPPGGVSATALVAEALALVDRRNELVDTAAALERELARYEPFGDFDAQALRDLAAAGVEVALGVAPAQSRLVAPEGVTLVPQGGDRRRRAFALVARRPAGQWPPDLGSEYEVVPWPRESPAALRAERAAAGDALAAVDDRLAALAGGRPAIAAHAAATADALRFAEVRAGMELAGEIAVLGGYVPVDACAAVRAAAGEHGWGFAFDDPLPGEDVPTLLRQSRWVRPVRAVFDFLHIYPGYWEADPGWVFLPFFTLFFAMIVGDAGYALLLLALTAVLRWRAPRIPAHVLHMMFLAGAATLFWGVINGSYFGFPPPGPFLAALEVPWIQDRDNLIDLCFLIGAVHLSFAHVWNATVLARAGDWTKVLAQVGWLAIVWSMFFLARQAVLGLGMPSFVLFTLLGGIVLVILFMKTLRELKASWIDHALLPLTLVGNFVDVLSYIRLFAVGYAGIAVLAAFNGMAESIGFGTVPTAVASSLILLFANALNIVLAGLGVLVHAVRLNTLEFSTHKGLAWQGHELYTPFAGPGRAA